MGSGGLRGLQIPRSDVQSVRGGFDSHTFPPFSRLRVAAGALIALALLHAAAIASAAPGAPSDSLRAAAAPDTARARTAAPDSARIGTSASPDSNLIEIRSNPRTRHGMAFQSDSVRAARLSAPPRWSEQPRWVMMRSLVVPGWGQLHNHAYFKAVLVAGGEGTLIGALISDHRELIRLERAAHDAQNSGSATEAQDAVNAYNARLDRFVSRQWLLAGVTVYALLDAYVDAHFKNFDIEFRAAPPGSAASGTQRLDLRWTF